MKNTKIKIASVFTILAFSIFSFIYLNFSSPIDQTIDGNVAKYMAVAENESKVDENEDADGSEWMLKTIIKLTESLLSGEISNNSSILN